MGISFSKIDWSETPSPKERIYFIVVLVLIVVAFSRLVWIPMHGNVKIKNKKIQDVRLQIATLEEFFKVAEKKEAEKRPKKIEAKVNADVRLEEVLKTKYSDPHQVISEVTNEITSSRKIGEVKLQNITFGSPIIESGYVKIPVTLNIFGTFSVLQRYLSRLEKLSYLFTVDNVKFTLSEKQAGIIDGELTCSLYVGSSGGMGGVETKQGGQGPPTIPPTSAPAVEPPAKKKGA